MLEKEAEDQQIKAELTKKGTKDGLPFHSVIKKMAMAKLEAVIENKKVSQIRCEGLGKIKEWITQAEWSKAQIMEFLTKLTAAYANLAKDSPDILTKAI